MPVFKKPGSYIIPFILFIGSFILRVSLISKGPFHSDSLLLAINSQKTFLTHKLHYLHSHGFPLTAILGALSVSLARMFHVTDPVLAVNFMSVLFSSLCIPIFYLFVNKLLKDRAAAVISASLLSLSPIFLGVSEYGNSHPPCLFFTVFSLLFLLSYLETATKKHLFISSFIFGLALSTRVQDALPVLPAVAVLLLSRENSKKSAKAADFIFFAGLALLTALIFYFPILIKRFNHNTTIIKKFLDAEIISCFKGLNPFLLKISFKYLSLNFSVLGLLSVPFGFILMLRKKNFIPYFLLTWFIVPYIIFNTLNFITPRIFLISTVPLYITIGYIFSNMFKVKPYFKVISASLILILCCLTFIPVYPVLKFNHQRELLPDFIRFIAKNTEQNAKIVVADERLFAQYYSHLTPITGPHQVIRPYTEEELQIYKNKIDSALSKGIPVYITSIALYSHDLNKQLSSFLERNYKLKLVGKKYAEDWHRGMFYAGIGVEYVFKMSRR